MWVCISDLRFQADAALLLCVMLVLNAFAAIFLVPAWIRLFLPNFIIQPSGENQQASKPVTDKNSQHEVMTRFSALTSNR